MKRIVVFVLVPLFMFGGFAPSPALASESLPQAELNRVVRGDDVVIIFPKENGPTRTNDTEEIPIGPVPPETKLLVADKDGHLPDGLSVKTLNNLEKSGKLNLSNLYTHSGQQLPKIHKLKIRRR